MDKLERLRKIKELAENGCLGEKAAALEKYNMLKSLYKITDDMIGTPPVKRHAFKYNRDYERKLLAQIIYMVCGDVKLFQISGKRILTADTTDFEAAEIGLHYEVYAAAIKKHMQAAYIAFVQGTIIPTEYQRIYDYYGFEGTSPGKLAAFLEEAGNEEVVLEINSPGGYVYAGMEMYNRLKLHSAKVTALVLSIAASAASVICCAAAEVQMMPVSQMMIHRAHSWAVGDKNDIYKTAEDLEKLDDTIANAYVDKTKLSKDKITALMDVTTWMGPEEAKKLGFADTILFREEEQPAMACDGVVMLSKAQILKLKERMDAEIQANEQQNAAALDLLRQKYNYLNLKGEEN